MSLVFGLLFWAFGSTIIGVILIIAAFFFGFLTLQSNANIFDYQRQSGSILHRGDGWGQWNKWNVSFVIMYGI